MTTRKIDLADRAFKLVLEDELDDYQCEQAFLKLIEAYEEHFGDKWDDVKHVLQAHMDASFIEFMDLLMD